MAITPQEKLILVFQERYFFKMIELQFRFSSG